MADLTTTVTESVVLNGALRGNTNSVTTTGINNVFERIVTCTHSQTTTVATFAAAPYTSAGAIDVENVRYIRVTNLDTAGALVLGVVTTNTNYQVRLTPGTSHIIPRGEAEIIGEEDTTPAFSTLENITSLQVRPEGATYNPQVAVFVASI
jgi:hypothetical protein|tara:strand:- start:284 stop:736 length:453 start_codon:yes stop_codon:yes gene_type:complete